MDIGQVADDGQEELKELLPVRFPKTERKEPAPLIVVYCVDRSDSMGRAAKFEIALTAVAESIALLDPESLVGVITFSVLSVGKKIDTGPVAMSPDIPNFRGVVLSSGPRRGS